jgi:hypothetical protein
MSSAASETCRNRSFTSSRVSGAKSPNADSKSRRDSNSVIAAVSGSTCCSKLSRASPLNRSSSSLALDNSCFRSEICSQSCARPFCTAARSDSIKPINSALVYLFKFDMALVPFVPVRDGKTVCRFRDAITLSPMPAGVSNARCQFDLMEPRPDGRLPRIDALGNSDTRVFQVDVSCYLYRRDRGRITTDNRSSSVA